LIFLAKSEKWSFWIRIPGNCHYYAYMQNYSSKKWIFSDSEGGGGEGEEDAEDAEHQEERLKVNLSESDRNSSYAKNLYLYSVRISFHRS
jgi:hypothetical protein